MNGPEQNRGRQRMKVVIAVLPVAVLVLLLFTFPVDASNDHPIRHALSGLGICACGLLAPLVMLYLPFGVLVGASALWVVYLMLIGFTRIGLVHWTKHLIVAFFWNLLGLGCAFEVGRMIT